MSDAVRSRTLVFDDRIDEPPRVAAEVPARAPAASEVRVDARGGNLALRILGGVRRSGVA